MKAHPVLVLALAWLWLPLACAELPSSRPLGSGPRAEGGRPSAQLPRDKRAPSSEKSEAPPPEPEEQRAEAPAKPSPPADADPPEAKPAPSDAPASTSQATSPAAFAGEYVGADVTTISVANMPDRKEDDPKARVNVEDTRKGIRIVLINSANSQPLCSLDATVSGAKATIQPGQSCFSEGVAKAVVEQGEATIDGKKLTIDMTAKLTIEMGDTSLNGSLGYHFEGERK